MKVGVALLLKSPMVSRESLRRVAQTAESLGYDYIAPNDRVVHPVTVETKYPYTDSGKVGAHWLKKDGVVIANSLELLTAMAFLAGCTQRIGLTTMVLVLPYRPPVLAAKMLATIDVLSDGRVTAGVGPGWLHEEYVALQNESFKSRGKLLDEYLEAFRSLFADDYPAYHGELVEFKDIVFEPKPVNRRIPIWIGGESDAALRRAARFADAWSPASTSSTRPMDTPEGFTKAVADLHAACEKEGRDPGDLGVVLWPGNFSRNDSGARIPFYGEPQQVVDDIAAYRERGLTGLTMHFQANDLNETLENMQRFAEDVRPHVS